MRTWGVLVLLLLPGCLLPETGPFDFDAAWDAGLDAAFDEGRRVSLVNAIGYERDPDVDVTDPRPFDGRTERWDLRVCIEERFAVIEVTRAAIDLHFEDGDCGGLPAARIDSDEAAAILKINSVAPAADATRVWWMLVEHRYGSRWQLLVEGPSGQESYAVDAQTGTYQGANV